MRSFQFAAVAATALLGAASGAGEVPTDSELLIESGYLGGVGLVTELKLGPDGALWMAGYAGPTGVAGAARPTRKRDYPRDMDGFVVRLDPATRALLSAAWIGGRDHDVIAGLEFDADGRAYVAGWTESEDFEPASAEPVAFPGRPERAKTFVARVSADSSGFEWVLLLGGSGDARARGLCMTDDGDPVVVGRTWSKDFEIVAPMPESTSGDLSVKVFVTRVRADGSSIVFSSLLGGKGNDDVYVVESVPGAILLAGESRSEGLTGTEYVLPEAPSVSPKAYLLEIDQAGTEVIRRRAFGEFTPFSMVVAPDALVVAGSISGQIPPTPGGVQVVTLSRDTWHVRDSVQYGGSGIESGLSLALGADGVVWLSGTTDSRDLPLAASIRPRRAGGETEETDFSGHDVFTAAFGPPGLTLKSSTYLGSRGRELGVRVAPRPSGTVWLAGSAGEDDFPLAGPAADRPIEPAVGGAPHRFFLSEIAHGDVALAPNAPLGVAAAVVADGVHLTWQDGGGGATAFAVDRELAGHWKRIAVVPAETTAWTDTTAVADHSYLYAIQAQNAAGGSAAAAAERVVLEPTLAVDLTKGQFLAAPGWRRDGLRARLRGTILRLDGGPVDVRAGGLEIGFFGVSNRYPVLAVQPGSHGWTERRGLLRYRDGATRVDFDPATGEYSVQTSTPQAVVSLGEPTVFEILSGRDAGTSQDSWRQQGARATRTP